MPLPKQMKINLADENAVNLVLPDEVFDYGEHFGNFARSYYGMAESLNASPEEAKQMLIQSILQTKPGVTVEQMTQALSSHLANGIYEKPSDAQLIYQRELHEKAVLAFVECIDGDVMNDKLGKVEDRNLRLLLRVNPDLKPETLNEIYEKRNETGDFAELLRQTNEKVFTRENLELLQAHGNEDDFLKNYPNLREIAAYAAGFAQDGPDGEESLLDISKKVLPPHEYDRVKGKGEVFRAVGQSYQDHMSFLVDPISTVISSEQLNDLRPKEVNNENTRDWSDSLSDTVAKESGVFASGEPWPTSIKNLDGYMNSFRQAKTNALGYRMSFELADKGFVDSPDVTLTKENGEKLDSYAEAYSYMVETRKTVKIQMEGDKKPVDIRLKDGSMQNLEVGEGLFQQEAPKEPTETPEPKRPGFFARTANVFSRVFTRKQTETMRQYKETLELHKKEKELYKNKELHEALKKAYGDNYAAQYEIFSIDGTQHKDAIYALDHAVKTGELLYMKKKGGDEAIPIQLNDPKNKEKGFVFGKDAKLPKEVKKPREPEKREMPEKPGMFSRMLSGIKRLFTGKPTETMRKYKENLEAYHDYREAAWKYKKDRAAYETYLKTRDVIKKAQEKDKETSRGTRYKWDNGKGIPEELIEKSYAGQQLKESCKLDGDQTVPKKNVSTIVTSNAVIESAQNNMDPKLLDDKQTFQQTKEDVEKTKAFANMMSDDFVEKLAKFIAENLRSDNFGSLQKIADLVGQEFVKNAVKKPVQKQKQVNKTAVKEAANEAEKQTNTSRKKTKVSKQQKGKTKEKRPKEKRPKEKRPKEKQNPTDSQNRKQPSKNDNRKKPTVKSKGKNVPMLK